MQRVMVVVDDPGLGLRIAMELAELGCTVHLAGTPERALRLAQRHALDTVFVDLRLAGAGDPSPTPLTGEGPILMTISITPRGGRRRAMVEALNDLFGTTPAAGDGRRAGHTPG